MCRRLLEIEETLSIFFQFFLDETEMGLLEQQNHQLKDVIKEMRLEMEQLTLHQTQNIDEGLFFELGKYTVNLDFKIFTAQKGEKEEFSRECELTGRQVS